MNNRRNVGIDLLRIYMSFNVVLAHCWYNAKQYEGLFWEILKAYRYIPVPVFFVLSFMLCRDSLNDKNKFSRRLQRLAIPYVFWILVYIASFGVYNILIENKYNLHMQDIIIQFLFGYGVNGVVWFLLMMIVLTIVMRPILQNKYANSILLFLILISFVLQYTGYNYIFFSAFPDYVKYSYGRLIEILPFACIGCLLADEKFKSITTEIIPVMLIVVIGLERYITTPSGFMFSGIKFFAMSVAFVIIFSKFGNRLNRILGETYISIISCLGKCSMGVFLIHVMVRDLINWRGYNFKTACAIYLISISISVTISYTKSDFLKKIIS